MNRITELTEFSELIIIHPTLPEFIRIYPILIEFIQKFQKTSVKFGKFFKTRPPDNQTIIYFG